MPVNKVILLKTKSTPRDNYEEHFAALEGPASEPPSVSSYRPVFVPVFEHTFRADELARIKHLVLSGAFSGVHSHDRSDISGRGRADSASRRYGGIIFTSQRAVEPFSTIIAEIRQQLSASSSPSSSSPSLDELLPASTPIFSVGPATVRAIKAIGLACPVLGEETGNGEKLADYILQTYHNHDSHDSRDRRNRNDSSEAEYGELKKKQRLPLLFIVGETRRDIIPRTLQSTDLPPESVIVVDEITVYETTVIQSFPTDFARALESRTEAGEGNEQAGASIAVAAGADIKQRQGPGQARVWVVVFSPTGCKAMLDTLGLLDSATGRAQTSNPVSAPVTAPADAQQSPANATAIASRAYIATIGPTTRDHLLREFGIDPHVCAAKPTPEALAEGILAFERGLGRTGAQS